MEKINIAEFLKDCPSGMELDCTMYDDVYFDYVDELNIIHCYIQHETHRTSITLNQHGTPNSDIKSKCVIFPKGKTTWEGFHRPYINGDIVYTIGDSIAILGDRIGEHSVGFRSYCGLFNYEFDTDVVVSPERFATEEEKAELFDVIKANGYKWNAETKTLEKLPKFKVGDIITNGNIISVINQITKDSYILDIKDDEICFNYVFFKDQDNWELVPNELEKLPKFKVGDRIRNIRTGQIHTVTDTYSSIKKHISFQVDNCGYAISYEFQDDYELVPNKFDINTLVPFESRVLVRSECDNLWRPAIFGFYLDNNYAPYYVVGGTCWEQCIPYEGNEHLRGKIDDCDEYFKTWE